MGCPGSTSIRVYWLKHLKNTSSVLFAAILKKSKVLHHELSPVGNRQKPQPFRRPEQVVTVKSTFTLKTSCSGSRTCLQVDAASARSTSRKKRRTVTHPLGPALVFGPVLHESVKRCAPVQRRFLLSKNQTAPTDLHWNGTCEAPVVNPPILNL